MAHKGKKAYIKKQKTENVPQNSGQKGNAPKKAKIIVRNLPFKNLSEKSVEDLFKECGEIEEVKLLRKDDGKFVGCGFVQFKNVQSAARAIRHCNQKEVYGRKIVVDWALPKDTFIQKVKQLEGDIQIKSEVLGAEEDTQSGIVIDKKPDVWNNEDESNEVKRENDSDEEDDDVDDDDDNDDDDENEEEEGDENSGEFDSEEDTDEDDENEEFDVKKSNKKNNKPVVRSNDVEEGKTLFIRNVPFSATNEDLKECVEKYGPVEYALICVDKLTEHSKGTAFVKFKEREDAIKCLKDSSNLFIDENPLTVTFAVSKENIEDKNKNKKQIKDSRNLYLIREGVVIAGSKAAVGVSASDMAKRLQLEQWKTQILKNLNMFISKTRLVIHNLPASYDDAKLKQLFAKYSNPKAFIKEAKVMREKKKVDSKGNGISKEVGFVSFTNHEDALTALRNINNNPNIFTPKRRPIVAFSIENKAVINAKKKSIEKSRAKLGIEMKDDKLSKLNRKQRRFIKRRQKFIERRKEAKKAKLGEVSEPTVEVKKSVKRKTQTIEEVSPKKKVKIEKPVPPETESFAGVTSKPGIKVKMRSKFKLKTQAKVHQETLKNEKKKRKDKAKKKIEKIRQPKQKKGQTKLMDDAKLSKLLTKHRESIQSSAVVKKWFDK